jgi:hypothetical protein
LTNYSSTTAITLLIVAAARYMASARTAQKTPLPAVLVACVRYKAMAVAFFLFRIFPTNVSIFDSKFFHVDL